VDDVTAARFLQLLRSEALHVSDLSVQIQALVDCLNLVPDFQNSFETRKKEVELSIRATRHSVLDDIDAMILQLKKSNGGA